MQVVPSSPDSTGSPPIRPRRVRLPKPRLQLKLVCGFLGVAALALLTQAMFLGCVLIWFSRDLPISGDLLAEATPDLVLAALVFSFCVLLPATVIVGVQLTFRTAGPIYRFERYFEEIAAGGDPGPVRLRAGDELTELRDAINDAFAERDRQARQLAAQRESDRAA